MAGGQGGQYTKQCKIEGMRSLILVGGGGHCKSVIDAAESIGYVVEGILGLPSEVGCRVLGYPVIGTDDMIPDLSYSFDFVITVGFIKDASMRVRLYDKIIFSGGHLATIVASTAYVSCHAAVGEGTVILHHASVNAGAVIGKNVIVNTFANVEHDAHIGNHSHISTGTMINGECIVGDRCFIGSQSVLANGITVCDDVIAGAGSLLRKSVSIPGIYAGNPAILMKRK